MKSKQINNNKKNQKNTIRIVPPSVKCLFFPTALFCPELYFSVVCSFIHSHSFSSDFKASWTVSGWVRDLYESSDFHLCNVPSKFVWRPHFWSYHCPCPLDYFCSRMKCNCIGFKKKKLQDKSLFLHWLLGCLSQLLIKSSLIFLLCAAVNVNPNSYFFKGYVMIVFLLLPFPFNYWCSSSFRCIICPWID